MQKKQNERILQCRTTLNLSQKYVAQTLNISIQELDLIEKGGKLPTDQQLEHFALLYGCNKEYFIIEVQENAGSILARNGKNISNFDQMQILELLAFQKEVSKQNQL
ncbi:helix-turn-helix domain-containing protein [Bacillus toyonensis]|uniref:helix-turn-helix domain-containing protein n=1 Tax=Bacillus toyonensis TaxID=155322 RepID=UPI001C01403D|nr:helix-turn-helix transcriptional regulator [Bacillus toyonensis]QWG94739.1 XRE family transcriptional regulator [Bacillus toyonensis]